MTNYNTNLGLAYDTFPGTTNILLGEFEAMAESEATLAVLVEGAVGTFTTATLRAKWQIAPLELAGLSLDQQSTVSRRPWQDIAASDGFNGHLLASGGGDWPDPLYAIGAGEGFGTKRLITRGIKLAMPCLVRAVLMQTFTGNGAAPNQGAFILTTALTFKG